MTNPKPKMTASYRAIFILSIFMIFFVLIAGAATKSKSSGFGMWIWGYTAWLMYKRRVSDLVSFYKVILWFDVIAAGVALAVLAFSDSDVSRYVGYSAIEATLLFGLVISLTYGLYRYFFNLQNNPIKSSLDENTESLLWEQVSEEIKNGKRVDSLWARAFSEADGDNNKANARYIKLRVNQIKSELNGKSTESDNNYLSNPKTKSGNAITDFWYSFNTIGKLALVGILCLICYGIFRDYSGSISIPNKPSLGSVNSPASVSIPKTSSEVTVSKVSNLCYAYWDGWKFVTGKTEGGEFKRFVIGRYGVEVMEVAIPIAMAKDFGIDTMDPKDVSLETGKSGAFFKENWYQLDALCVPR